MNTKHCEQIIEKRLGLALCYLFLSSLRTYPTSEQEYAENNHGINMQKPTLQLPYIPFSPLTHRLNSNHK